MNSKVISRKRLLALLLVVLMFVMMIPAASATEDEETLILTLDAGHGGNDPGAQANGKNESELNLTIVKYIKSYLEQYDNVKVYLTRETDNENPELEDRILTGVNNGSEAVISFHLNAGGGTGCLACVTNGLYDPYNIKESDYALAQSILDSLENELGIKNNGFYKRSTTEYLWPNGQEADFFKNNYYGIMNGITSMIIENCYMDSDDYSRYLNSDEKLRAIAKADADGIAAYYGLKNPEKTYDYKNHWSRTFVETALENGWVAGYDEYTFKPDGVLTRAMCATILASFDGYDINDYQDNVFPDVPENVYYTAATVWASKNGIMDGYPNGNFGPNDPVTREQLAVIIRQYCERAGYDTEVESGTAQIMEKFDDKSDIAHWAYEAVEFCVQENLMTGVKTNQFSPKTSVTRAQLCVVLTQLNEILN